MPVFELQNSDNTYYQVLNPWPESTAYNEAKYVEFQFNPQIPSTTTIDSFRIINEYGVDQVPTGMNAKLEVYKASTGDWADYSLSTPDSANTDTVDTINIDTLISTPQDANVIKIRFLSYATDTFTYYTLHDNLTLKIFTPSSLYIYTPYGGDDETDTLQNLFAENQLRISDNIGYGTKFWPQQADYDETRYVEFVFKPNVPLNRTVTQTSIINEWRPNHIVDSTYAKLEVYKNSTGEWGNYSLSVPTHAGVDTTDTIDLSSFINTASDVDSIRIKFLAYTKLKGTDNKFKSFHDLITLSATYSTIISVSATSLAPDSAAPGDTNIAMEELTLSTDVGWAFLDSVTIENRTTDGRVNYADISLAKFFKETNGTLGFQTTDSLISSDSLTDDGSGGTVTLPVGDTIYTAGRIFYIVYDISTTATVGDYVGVKLADSTYLNILSPDIASNANFPIQSNGTLIDAPSTAIELSNFTGLTGYGYIRLFWSGGGVNRWEIWKKSENEMGYSLIASIPGNDWKNYSYTDRDVVPFKVYHYLLKGGRSEDSISLMLIPAKDIFSVSPTVSAKGIKITYSISEPTSVSLRIIDIGGRTVSNVYEGQQSPGIHFINYQKNIFLKA